MQKSLELADVTLQKSLAAICAFLVFVMIVAVGGQVIMRYAFNAPLVWSEELARYAMIWLAMLGCALCSRLAQHIALTDLIPFPPRLKLGIAGFGTIFTVLVLAILFWYSWDLAARVSRQTSSSLGIPMSAIYAAIPVGSLLMIAGMILGLFAEFSKSRRKSALAVETAPSGG